MAYKEEKSTGDIVISGWETGISSSPHNGIGDLKCLNVSSMPGEVSVNYARVQQSQTPIVAGTFAGAAGVFVTYSGTTPLIVGSMITIAASPSSTITNLTTSGGVGSTANYYVVSVSGTTIELSASFRGSPINNFGTTGTATFSTINMGKPTGYAYTSSSSFPNFQYFVLDANGLVWEQDFDSSTWSLLQPTIGGNGVIPTGIFCFGSYVIVVSDFLWYKGITSQGTAWAKFTGAVVPTLNFSGVNFPHPNVLIPSGWIVICDGNYLDTLAPVAGISFDPTNAATYSWNGSVGSTPNPVDYAVQTNSNQEVFTCIAMIGNGSAATGGTGGATNVIVGGQYNLLYPWAPGTSFFQPVIFMSESYTQALQTVNNLVYVFPGSKGNVYVTNGSSLTSVISLPDYVANSTGTDQDPYFIWGGVTYERGRIWMSAQAPNCGGVWSFIPTINAFVEQDVGMSLRLEHQNSYGTYAGMATILFTPQQPTGQQAEGVQYFSGWTNGSSTFGMDFSGTTPYTSFAGGTGTSPYTGAAIIETDLIPIGTLLNKTSFAEIEYKLSAPLVSGENVGINYRPSTTSAWLPLTLTQKETTNPISGIFIPGNNMQILQWVQLQVILGSTATNPSYTRLTELRLR